MNIPDFIASIVTSASVTAILFAVLIFLSKSWISERLKNAIKNEYDEKLESHKSTLMAENGRILEKLKAELQLVTISHQIQYSKLHEERAMVIKELHKKLDKLGQDIHSLVNPMQWVGESPIEEKNKIAFESGKDFEQYYRGNKIFFSKSLCKMIDEVQKQIYSSYHWFTEGHKRGKSPVSTKAGEMYSEHCIQAWKKLEEIVFPLKEKIEDQFRGLLGVEDEINPLPTGLPQ